METKANTTSTGTGQTYNPSSNTTGSITTSAYTWLNNNGYYQSDRGKNCDSCMHSTICKYEKECRKNLERVRNAANIHINDDFMTIYIDCKYYKSAWSWSPSIVYCNNDNGYSAPNKYEITCNHTKEN